MVSLIKIYACDLYHLFVFCEEYKIDVFKKFKYKVKVASTSLQPHGLQSPCNSPAQNTGVGSLSLLQRIFPTQGWNTGLPHCRRILYQLKHVQCELSAESLKVSGLDDFKCPMQLPFHNVGLYVPLLLPTFHRRMIIALHLENRYTRGKTSNQPLNLERGEALYVIYAGVLQFMGSQRVGHD